MYDILIVGGGAAGLTAAIYARRAGRTALVLEAAALGGQIVDSPLVENYPGLSAVSGGDFADALSAQAKALGAEVKYGRVTAAERTAEGFKITAGKREYVGRALILATGAKPRKLGVENEDSYVGRGVSYCATCDGAFFKNKDVAVVGGGDSALQAALFLSQLCKSVTLIHRRGSFRAQQVYVDAAGRRENISFLLDSQITALHGEGRLTRITVAGGDGAARSLAVEGLFVAVGHAPDNGAFSSLAELDESGYFAAGEDCAAKTPGVFVAGDCRAKTLRQLTTAAADGSVAATAACRWLDEQ